jgi:hypothetical protein
MGGLLIFDRSNFRPLRTGNLVSQAVPEAPEDGNLAGSIFFTPGV